MTNALQVLTTRNLNGVKFNCYHEDGQDAGDFWATREQIGELLGYDDPKNAITKIHSRNKARLDKFLKRCQIVTPMKGARTAIVYNFKGLLEICRYSNQPKANAVIDWLWKIANELRRTGTLALASQISRLQAENAELKTQIANMYPLHVLGATVMAQKGSVTFQSAAQFLAQHGLDIEQNRLFRFCRNKKLLCSRKGRQYNKPTQKAINKGLLNLEVNNGFNAIAVVTPEGMKYLTAELGVEQYPLLMLIDAAD
ncbi:MAG: phage antirepressor KilAC domain-containing protein [Synergistaceae bacterium]|nr:phage antirepressor KilAC domain-containing protein [Synergistaceae bacterium]